MTASFVSTAQDLLMIGSVLCYGIPASIALLYAYLRLR